MGLDRVRHERSNQGNRAQKDGVGQDRVGQGRTVQGRARKWDRALHNMLLTFHFLPLQVCEC